MTLLIGGSLGECWRNLVSLKKLLKWILCCITYVYYSPAIYGFPISPFYAARILRQVDPLFPYLFATGIKYFSRLLQQLHGYPLFHYHPKCKKHRLTQLLFIDDLLLFCKAIPLLYQCYSISLLHFLLFLVSQLILPRAICIFLAF